MGLVLLVLPPALGPTASACAGTIVNVCGKFSFWVPDDWKAVTERRSSAERTTYQSADGALSVVVGPLADKEANLSDEEVSDSIEEELDDVKVASDKSDKIDNFNIRRMDGTAEDDGDPVIFKALALDPGAAAAVLQVLVYGALEDMNRTDNEAVIERILRSLRPQP
jgi:hypothetical protein